VRTIFYHCFVKKLQ